VFDAFSREDYKMKRDMSANTPERIGELILYSTPDGGSAIQLRLEEGTVWLSQKEMAALYQISVSAVAQHLRAIFASGELEPYSVIKQNLITATDRKNYQIKLYRLEVVLAVGYRVRSHRGVQFRQWATEHLRRKAQRERQMRWFCVKDDTGIAV
jgi:hypothetical protein